MAIEPEATQRDDSRADRTEAPRPPAEQTLDYAPGAGRSGNFTFALALAGTSMVEPAPMR